MKHTVNHGLGKEKAVEVCKKAFDSYKERFAKYNPTANWVSDTKANIGFTAKGVNLQGGLEVNDSTIEMDLDVPFLLKPFKGKAMAVIEEEIQKWVGKAKAGEL
ncbi:MAG: polyhydroxyalkanoic acid system family protein [Polyangiaceae bacterium]|nr:polyhydroxyalkanoic acid system family protein [Polyangiaceae bacterium]MCB9609290.1 polyhydroxyalkanoic acid system family protein [Polyangiaceae bacterium]